MVCAAETSEEIGADRVEDVVAREGELVDQIEGHLWAGDLGDHDSAVEGDDRGWGDCEELLVQRGMIAVDAPPGWPPLLEPASAQRPPTRLTPHPRATSGRIPVQTPWTRFAFSGSILGMLLDCLPR